MKHFASELSKTMSLNFSLKKHRVNNYVIIFACYESPVLDFLCKYL